jgi:DNA polymerase-1
VSALDDVQLHLVDSVEEAGAFMRWLGERHDVLAFDTETEGLEWWHERVRLIQIGDSKTGWAIPWDLWGGVAMEALSSYAGPLVGHNVGFDVKMVERWCTGLTGRWQFDWQNLHDTRVMAHILEPNEATGLKPLSTRRIDSRAGSMQRNLDYAMRDNGWSWATVPLTFAPYWQYAALDVVLTAQLYEQLHPEVMAEAPDAYDLEMATSRVLVDMERKGVAVDLAFTQEKRQAFERYVVDAETWCIDNFGVKPGSNSAVIERIQRDVPEDVYTFSKRTNGGALSLDREVLAEVAAATQHPLAEMVLQRRKIQKLASAYLSNFERFEFEGRIHPSYHALKNEGSKYGARTGRMSVADPALQQLPKKSKDGSNPAADVVRNCFTASDGCTLLMSDFDQIEARLLAHFSQDPGLLGAFSEGDFFTNVARQLYNDPTIQQGDPRRQPTKNATYARIYGAGPEKFAKTAGIALEQAYGIFNQLSATYPGIDSFFQQVIGVGESRLKLEGQAYVLSPLTKRKHVATIDKVYALVNYLIQGTAAEVLKRKDIELHSAGLGEHLILNVHDEVILDVPDEDLEEAKHIVSSIMNDDQIFPSVPLTAGIDTSFRWGGG